MDIEPVKQSQRDFIKNKNPEVTDEEIDEYHSLMINRMKSSLEAFKAGLPLQPWPENEESRYKELAKKVHV